MFRAKSKTIKIKPWSFHSTIPVRDEDGQRFSKANEIRAFYSFDTRQSNEPVQHNLNLCKAHWRTRHQCFHPMNASSVKDQSSLVTWGFLKRLNLMSSLNACLLKSFQMWIAYRTCHAKQPSFTQWKHLSYCTILYRHLPQTISSTDLGRPILADANQVSISHWVLINWFRSNTNLCELVLSNEWCFN